MRDKQKSMVLLNPGAVGVWNILFRTIDECNIFKLDLNFELPIEIFFDSGVNYDLRRSYLKKSLLTIPNYNIYDPIWKVLKNYPFYICIPNNNNPEYNRIIRDIIRKIQSKYNISTYHINSHRIIGYTKGI